MIYNIEYETMPREAIESIQLKRLQAVISHVYATVPFYRKKLDDAGGVGVFPVKLGSVVRVVHSPLETFELYIG